MSARVLSILGAFAWSKHAMSTLVPCGMCMYCHARLRMHSIKSMRARKDFQKSMRNYETPVRSAWSAMLRDGHARTFAIRPRQESCLVASLFSTTSHSQEKSEDCKHA
jgi:hypothetical protein